MDYAVIMAGGTGKRLWPLSRNTRPKQCLKLVEGETLIRHCFKRLQGLVDDRNIIVLSNENFCDIIRENIPEIPPANVIAEPAVRDTSGAIGLAASILTKVDPDATMAVVTADHLIEPKPAFQQAMSDALKYVNTNPDEFVIFGIEPNYPSTQFGYVEIGQKKQSPTTSTVLEVKGFREKPNQPTAEQYLQQGNYVWNSGMFVWKASTVLKTLKQNLPETAIPLEQIAAAWDTPQQNEVLKQSFVQLPKISIDYAVMEKATNVNLIKLPCKWVDLGSFLALSEIVKADGNKNVVIAPDCELLNCKDSIVVTEQQGHLIAGIGLQGIVIAHTADATLVCPADQTHRLKELLESVQSNHQHKYL